MSDNIQPPRETVNQILNLFNTDDFEKLQNEINKVLTNFPNGSTSWLLLGMFYNKINNLDKAEESLTKALEIDSNYPEVNRIYADTLRKKGQLEKSIIFANKAKDLAPNSVNILDTLGTCLASNKQYKEAEKYYDLALNINDQNPIVLNNLANCIRNTGEYERSIKYLEKALDISPKMPEIHINLAISFIENKNYNKALISLERISGLNLNPYNRSRVYASYGHIYLKLFKYEESETYYLKSIDNSKYIQNGVYEGLAQISIVKRDYIQALSYIDKRIASSELKNESISSYIVAYSYLFESNQKKIFDKICEYAKLMQSEEKSELNYSKDKQKKLRVGFISGDFCEHPVSYFLEGLMREFNDHNFESYGYYNFSKFDKMTDILINLFTKFRNISGLNDKEKIKLICSDEIDIIIDLSGHTSHNALSVMKSKVAPIQMTWLGFSQTTGINEIDYIICDSLSIQEDDEKWYVETPLRLQNSYYCFSAPNEKEHPIKIKEDNDNIFYGNFGNTRKINKNVIKVWSSIILKNKKAKLILKSESFRSSLVKNQILRDFESHRVNSDKIIFETDELREKYLSKYNDVDVILDTFPYPGGTTTCESLFMGTPVISLAGKDFLSRNGENILRNLKLDYFVAQNINEYIEIATNFKKVILSRDLRKKTIRKKFLDSPLVSNIDFSDDFKLKLRQSWEKLIDDQI